MAAYCGLSEDKLEELKTAVTANQIRRLLPEQYVRVFCDRLCSLAVEKCRNYIYGKSDIECIMSDYNGSMLGSYYAEK